jgi:hypothetical protein
MPFLETHASPYAGQWYPAEPGALDELIDSCLADSEARTGSVLPADPAGLVVPHAGITYSGGVAATAYRHLSRRPPERIFLLGFSHRGGPSGIWLPDVEAYQTPLGTMAVDLEAIRALAEGNEFRLVSEERLCDHSVEIQLPFLSRSAPRARLVPVYVSHPAAERRRAAARRLAGLAGPADVLIASSDFTHYGRAFGFQPFPVDARTGDRLRALDEDAMEAAASLDEEIFLASLDRSGATVCGREPISLLLATLAAMEDDDEFFQEKLDYRTSGEMTGGFEHSVSYAALGYFRHSSLALSGEEQRLLLESARKTLERYQRTGRREPAPPEPRTAALDRRAGVFVSLHQRGELRGCVGQVTPQDSLAAAVPAMTLAAATEDSRFSPVGAEETGIEIEISVLSPLKRVASKNRIVAGVHGVYVDTGWRRGLLLPQVASERGWNTARFLEALAAKIGARPEAFDAPETRLYRFRAQVFH